MKGNALKMNNLVVGGVTVELLMGVVAPIMGISLTCVIIKMTFGFNFWLAILIAVPLGTIIGWVVMISFIFIIFKLSQVFGSNSKNSNLLKKNVAIQSTDLPLKNDRK